MHFPFFQDGNLSSIDLDYPNGGITSNENVVPLVLKCIVLISIILLAIFSNLLVVISVFRYHKLRHINNYFLVSLAVADLLVACFAMTFNATVEITGKVFFNIYILDMRQEAYLLEIEAVFDGIPIRLVLWQRIFWCIRRSMELRIQNMWFMELLRCPFLNCINITSMLYCCGPILCHSTASQIYHIHDRQSCSPNDWSGLDSTYLDLIFAHFFGMVYNCRTSKMERKSSQWVHFKGTCYYRSLTFTLESTFLWPKWKESSFEIRCNLPILWANI